MNKFTYKLIALTSLIVLPVFAAEINLHKTPECGCCEKWSQALKDSGYDMQVHDAHDLNKIKIDLGLPLQLGACHTGVMGNYVIEGHVPTQVIKWLEETQPDDIIGVSVPGMPQDSLGMENSEEQEEYIVYGFNKSGVIKELFKYKSTELLEDYTL